MNFAAYAIILIEYRSGYKPDFAKLTNISSHHSAVIALSRASSWRSRIFDDGTATSRSRAQQLYVTHGVEMKRSVSGRYLEECEDW